MSTLSQILTDTKVISPSNVKMTEPKLLSECGSVLTVDGTAGEQYQIEIEPGDFLVVRAGAAVGKPSFRFTHPNVAASVKTIHEFKHYRHGGSKFWTAKAGMDFYFVIPRSAVKILPEKGYSYIPAEINGVKVRFNVAGGTKNGWTDWLNTCTQISVNHKVRDLNKLAEVAVKDSPLGEINPKGLEPDREIEWKRLAARATQGLIEKIAKMVAEKKAPVVKLLPGFEDKEGKAVEVIRRVKRVNLPPSPEGFKRWRNEYNAGAVKSLILGIDGHFCKVRVKVGQIDWAATAEANGIAA